eukprot:110300_1
MSHRSKWYKRKRRLQGLGTSDDHRLCQKCLSTEHFTFECRKTGAGKYRKKESATQKLKRWSNKSKKERRNELKAMSHLPPDEILKRQQRKELQDALQNTNNRKRKHKKKKPKKSKERDISSEEENDSDTDSSSSDSGSSSSSSDSSSSGSDSSSESSTSSDSDTDSSYSSISESDSQSFERKKKKRKRNRKSRDGGPPAKKQRTE